MIYRLGNLIPNIGENNFIAENSTIIGDVTTGKNVSIWFNAVVRGDMSEIIIGDNSNIQDNCTVHSDSNYTVKIGKGVTVGHNAIIHGCEIGDNCVIGMGSIVLNGVKIPNNCLIGAGSLVTPKLKLEEGVLVVGNPARVVRKLDKTNKEYLKYASEIYVEDIEKYKKLEIIGRLNNEK